MRLISTIRHLSSLNNCDACNGKRTREMVFACSVATLIVNQRKLQFRQNAFHVTFIVTQKKELTRTGRQQSRTPNSLSPPSDTKNSTPLKENIPTTFATRCCLVIGYTNMSAFALRLQEILVRRVVSSEALEFVGLVLFPEWSNPPIHVTAQENHRLRLFLFPAR